MKDNKIREICLIRENPRFRRYPEYKESGVEWIGEIPKDWNAVPLTKYLESIIDYRGRTPEKTEDGRFLVTAKNIRDGQIDYEISQEFTSEDEYQRLMTRGVPQIGDVLFTTEAPLGEVANVDDISIALAQRVIKFRPKPDFLNPYFLKYWILSYFFQSDLQRYATGSTARGIKASKLCLLKLNLPPVKEQTQIANFLDRKTEQIDELIRIKERQIELLQEQRTALINQAVTRGLDRNVEMKPSGVEWIGDIPRHWEVRRNKRIFNERDDRSATGKEELLTVSHITGVSPRAEKKNVGMFLAQTLEGYKHCSVGNLVINTMWAWMGALGISAFDGIVSPSYNVYELKSDEYLPRYYDYLYRTPNHVNEIIRWSKGIWTSRWRLYPDAFFRMFTIMPPFREQVQITDFLDHKTEQIGELITAEQRKIELLKEYRQSLISEAVTGKIDVRNEG